jgi:hypothetical protein
MVPKENYAVARLEKIQADLARSHSRLSQIKADLQREQLSPVRVNPEKTQRIESSAQTIKIDAIEIIKTCRFGNSTQQLINVFYFCLKNNISKIYTRQDFPYINSEVKISQNEEIELLVQGKPALEEVLLSGRFYHPQQLNCNYSSDEYVNIFDKYILPKIKLPVSPIAVSDTDLVIHLRSGDIFAESSRYPGYGQPPLSFYQKVIEQEKPNRCILVFEDKGNVCIEQVEIFLTQKAIPFICQSSDVYSDIACLKSSVNLIVGRGTFGNAITLLTNRLKKVYFFESRYKFKLALLRGAKVFRVCDKPGNFKSKVLTDWQNPEEQKKLMLNYDSSNLEMQNLTQTDRLW